MQLAEERPAAAARPDPPAAAPGPGEATPGAAAEPAPRAASGSPGGAGPPAGKPSKRFVDEDSKSPEYRSDSWRMANFKVVPCSKRYAHDWTICPFAHPGEKARRRDPRLYNYAGIACPEMKKAGFCSRGDRCPYAHNVFEFWLHPTRYRTQLCNDGQNCTRNVCFFAHSLEEMRSVPGKVAEARKDTRRNGMLSPDTPFIHTGSSLATTSSTGSSEVWGMLSPEERARSQALPPEDAAAKGVEELASSLANVKLAMSSEKREEVITLVTKLLQEAKEEGQGQRGPGGGYGGGQSSNREAELLLALRALDASQAQALLPEASSLTSLQLANLAAEPGSQRLLQELLQAPAPGSRPPSASNPLLTAPAAMEQQQQLPRPGPDRPHPGLGRVPLAGRVLSADMGLAPSHGLWQHPAGFSDALSRGPPGPFGPADPGELRRRAFGGLDQEGLGLGGMGHMHAHAHAHAHGHAKADRSREVRRPPISAFQKAATQEWKHPPGRNLAPHELKWGNSGSRLSSSDLGTISEGLPSLAYASTDLLFSAPVDGMHRPPSAGLPGDRARSLSGLNIEPPSFNLLAQPLSLPATQRGGRDTSALHTAPFDLALAYAAEAEFGAAQQQQPPRAPAFEPHAAWGPLPTDYSQPRF